VPVESTEALKKVSNAGNQPEVVGLEFGQPKHIRKMRRRPRGGADLSHDLPTGIVHDRFEKSE
jgi:hypothetical protein